LLFDIVVCEKGCAGGGLGLAVAGSTDLLLCVFLEAWVCGFADLWSDLEVWLYRMPA
jgi:hypothetical protein